MTGPAYPLPSRSEEDHWPMSHGLVEDVAEALSRHGYPEVRTAADYVRLRQHVWHFITDKECDVLDTPAADEPGETDRADDEPHLVDGSSKAMRELLRRVAAGQLTADDAMDVLADWPKRSAETDRADDELEWRRRVAVTITDLSVERDRLRAQVEHLRTQLADSDAGWAKAEQQRRAALALIDDLLRPWNTGRPVHPGYEGVEAGFQYRRHVDEWNARRVALGAADEPTTGGASDE